MSSPILFGPNNTAANLQNAILNANGALLSSNGPKNYITYGNFENNSTTGWSLGTIGTLTNGLPTSASTPTFGSGAAGTLGISTVSSGKLAGNFSLQLASSAATVAGNMLASDAYAIDISDQAKVLSFRFNYKLAAGSADFSGTKTNSFAVAVWDATNSSFIPVTGAFNLVQSSGVGIAQGTFQTNASTASIRFIVYCANATSGAVTLLLDEIYCGPQSLAFGPPMSDPVQYTPTFTGFGTVTTSNVRSRRENAFLCIDGWVTMGTNTATTAQITLGFNGTNGGLTVDSGVTANQVVGSYAVASANIGSGSILIQPGAGYITFGQPYSTGTNSTLSTANGSLLTASTTMSFTARVPIAGWSSNTVMSADSDTRVVAAQLSGTPTGGTGVGVVLIFPTVTSDTAGGYNVSTGRYTVGVSGYYNVSAFLASTTASNNVAVYVNGSVSQNLFITSSAGAGSGTALLKCNAGDIIDIRPTGAGVGTTGASYLNINRLSGPATVAASESVTCTVALASTYTPAVNTVIKYDTVLSDSHAKYSTSTGLYTCPSPGTYRVSVSADTSSTSTGVYLTQNGVGKVYLTSTQSANTVSSGSQSIKCNAGDTLGIFINANSPMVGASAPYVNCASFERVGN